MSTRPTPGQQAYEADLRERAHYEDGRPRKAWSDLPGYARRSWEIIARRLREDKS